MLTYDQVSSWTDCHDLIVNRVAIMNQILGCRYDHSPDNPFVLERRRKGYVCKVCDAAYESWDLYNAIEAERALCSIESLKEGLWLLNRSGRLKYT